MMEFQRKGSGCNNAKNTNICFYCQNACGGCSWSEINPDTKKPRFEPVPGWTAKLVFLNIGSRNKESILVETYHITNCPQFIPDEPRKKDTRELSEKENEYFLEYINSILRRWNDE